MLTATNKVKALEGKLGGEIVGKTGTNREDFQACHFKLAPLGISLDCIMTSLGKVLDVSLRTQADVNIDKKMKQMRSTIPLFESKRADDSPENTSRWDQMIELTRLQIEETPE